MKTLEFQKLQHFLNSIVIFEFFKAILCLVPQIDNYYGLDSNRVELGLNGPIQYENSSLALAISNYFIARTSKYF